MSSTLGVQRWFRSSAGLSASADELTRHAREFGFTFVGDDDDFVKEEEEEEEERCAPPLPPVPPLIPLGEAAVAAAAGGRLDRASDIDCDDSGGSSVEPGTYGGVITVNSDTRGGGSDDEDKLLRLFGGGGDSDASSAGVDVVGPGPFGGASGGDKACADGGCAVVLDPLPSELVRSLSSRGRVSAERASEQVPRPPEGAGAGSGSGSAPPGLEVRGLLHDLVSEVAIREERCEREPRRSPRAPRPDGEAGAAPAIDASARSRDDEADAEGEGEGDGESEGVRKKARHRKSESPRKAVRRRRERRSSSSGGGGPPKKRRKRSTSTCSTTSSTCSTASARHHHKHHHKHHKHRRRGAGSPLPLPAPADDPPPTPRVNPIFVWIKQDNTRIVEVLCEDYDKRNRIRLTRTAHGWRAVPRTERLASSTVTSGELLVPPPTPPPPQPPAAAAALPGASDHEASAAARDAALAGARCTPSPPDGSAGDQNNATSLVPALRDSPVHEHETKDDDEVVVLEDMEEVARESPVKEIEDDESERYEGEGQTSGIVEDNTNVTRDVETIDEIETEEMDCVEKEEEEEDEEEEEHEQEHVHVQEMESEELDGHDEERPSGTEMMADEDSVHVDEGEVDDEGEVPKDENHDDIVEESEIPEPEPLEEESPVLNDEEGEDEDEGRCPSPVESHHEEENEEAPQADTNACDAAVEDRDIENDIDGAEEEDDTLAPTDLSLPKAHCEEQDIPLNCKNIPHNISTVIPPVVPSPQPRMCPAYPPATPAHQIKPQTTSKFLESLLSSPRKCHELPRRPNPETEKGPAPLDLGITSANRGAGSPTVSCSDESRKVARPAKEPAEGEPKAKSLKIEDITLKNLLSRQPDTIQNTSELDLSLVSKKEEAVESGRKSRLLELLTSEPTPASVSPSPTTDPLSQLKKVLSDPDISVPDPLLVPRDRLHDLVLNPAKEIPRLLAGRPELRLPEALAYPTLLRDPDLLVVSLSHLHSLLQKSEKSSKENDPVQCSNLGNFVEYQMYQNQQQAAVAAKEFFDSQMKIQQQQDDHHKRHQHQQRHQQQLQQQELDAAAAAALNQMLWLPYLTQLEAAAAACGNPQDFLSILNTVFPPNYPQPDQSIPPPPPTHMYGSMNPSFNVHPNDLKSQMEIQNALVLWHSAMSQAATANALNNNNSTVSNNNHRSSKPSPNSGSKSLSTSNGRYPTQNSRKYNSNSSARTSPLTPSNFHSPPPAPAPSPQLRGRNSHSPSAASYLTAAGGNIVSPTHGSTGYPTSQLHQQYNMHRNRQSTNGTTPLIIPKANSSSFSKTSSIRDVKASVNGQTNGNCKTLFNLLDGPGVHRDMSNPLLTQPLLSPSNSAHRQTQQQHAHLLAALGKPASNNSAPRGSPTVPPLLPLPPSPLDLSGPTKKAPTPKLKVKEHLVDPTHTPKLLKADPSPEVTTPHAPLWHPLFGSQKTSLNSPWNWTTVTVNGE